MISIPSSKILDAHNDQDIRELINTIKKKTGNNVTWNDVGGRENNLATINMGTDPAGAVTERITNAIDSILELEWQTRGRPSNISSPREAVEKWFGISDGKMNNVDSLRTDEIQKLRDRIRVTLQDSRNEDRPTVDIRDFGIGIQAEDFSDTILSLNRSRKMKKFHLAGAFGQGGSTALAYSNYTLIVSRAADIDSNGPHPVAFTVVRFNEGDLDEDKHGTYEYMVNPRTGQPFQLELNEQEFQHGTLVRHVTTEVGKFASALTSPTSGFYYLAHHYLFDPLLPFSLEENRSSRQEALRTAAGNNRRLSHSDITEYQRSSTQSFREGEVTLKWWVLSTKEGSKKPRNRIKNYTLASKPVIVTYNGQKQGEFPNSVIKKDLKLPYLERFIVVHVDCDDIDNRTRRELFPTTRENLRDSTIQEDLRELIVSTLREDDNLRRLDRERKQEYLQRTDSDSVDRIRKRLAERIQGRIESEDGDGGGTDGDDTREPREPTPEPEPIPVETPPTFIEITSTEPRTVYPGQRFTISFETDAKPDYFQRTDSFVPIVDPVGIAEYTGTTSVRDGHGKAHFIVPQEASVGNKGQIALEVRPDHSPTLSDKIEVEVQSEDEQDTGSGDGRAKVPNIEPQWVQKGAPFWEQAGWDETDVVEVRSDEESTVVHISADNENLNNLIERAQRKGSATVDAIKDFYMEHVAYHAVIAHLDLNEVQEEDSVDLATLETEQEWELKRLSQTICGIIDEMFDVISQGDIESGSSSGGAARVDTNSESQSESKESTSEEVTTVAEQ